MAGCDITNGRLANDCKERAGVKTVFFFRHSLLNNITRNGAGEITNFGNGTVLRFEQDTDHGAAMQEIVKGGDNASQFVRFQLEMTVFFVTPSFLQSLNALKNGLWAIFFMDYHDKIRLMGESTAMQETQATGQSGETAEGGKYLNMTFTGLGGEYAPYLEAFTDYPFDNFPVGVQPPYVPGEDRILINATDFLLIDNSGNKLKYAG
jgi:hypothetical protein